MTQKQRLLGYLNWRGSVTPLVAWTELGIYRLSATIFELRKEGVNIKTTFVDVKNKFEESCHVAKYTLH